MGSSRERSKQARRFVKLVVKHLWGVSIANRGQREGGRARREAVKLVGAISVETRGWPCVNPPPRTLPIE